MMLCHTTEIKSKGTLTSKWYFNYAANFYFKPHKVFK